MTVGFIGLHIMKPVNNKFTNYIGNTTIYNVIHVKYCISKKLWKSIEKMNNIDKLKDVEKAMSNE